MARRGPTLNSRCFQQRDSDCFVILTVILEQMREVLAHQRNLTGTSSPRTRNRRWAVLAIIWALAVFAVLPVIFHVPAPPPRISRTALAIQLGYVAAALICYCFYRIESPRLGRSGAIGLVFSVFLLTSIANHIHYVNVDHGRYFFAISNEGWQENLQNDVVRLSPEAVPHSYRFLPNGIVRWIQLGSVRFDVARDVFRLLSGLLLFYSIYRYARLYTNHVGGILAMLLVSVVYPVSLELYAGQLTDPLSYLSFVLAFIFLETEDFPFLLTTLLIGSLAKETVLALFGYYILFCRKERNYGIKASVLSVASLVVYFGVRMYVLKGTIQYKEVSGVSSGHILLNWQGLDWPVLFVLTGCAYLPFLVIGWKKIPLSLKRMVFFLLPVLFISSLLFSWLSESRNFMPLVFVLAAVTARYFTGPAQRPGTGRQPPIEAAESSSMVEV